VKQTRCSTCDADHDYKQARVPRIRRKTEPPAALAAQGFGAPKLHDHPPKPASDDAPQPEAVAAAPEADAFEAHDEPFDNDSDQDQDQQPVVEEGPVHRRLIRASLPRAEGQPPPPRQNPEFTIRQPNNNRQNRFRPRHGAGGGGGGRGPMQSNGNGNRSFGGGFSQRQHSGTGNQQGRRRNRGK
jgi:hypothetical protein